MGGKCVNFLCIDDIALGLSRICFKICIFLEILFIYSPTMLKIILFLEQPIMLKIMPDIFAKFIDEII